MSPEGAFQVDFGPSSRQDHPCMNQSPVTTSPHYARAPHEPALPARPHILVVDDDTRISSLISRYLWDHGYVAVAAHNAAEARAALSALQFDAAVVDVMMPGESGIDLTRDIHARMDLPVILLTALSEAPDRIAGLEAGADDYLGKPFEPRELLLRLQSMLRRKPAPEAAQQDIRIGRWVFAPALSALQDGAEKIALSAAEATLLRALASRPGVVMSREELSRKCALEGGERAIDVQVTRLRRKLGDDPRSPAWLQTVRGKGYLLRTGE